MGPTVIETNDIEQILRIIMAHKYILKAGLKCLGAKGEHAVSSEMNQTHDMQTFVLLYDINIYKKNKVEALAPLMLLTEKIYDKIKGRTCAHWRKKTIIHKAIIY